MLKGTRLFSFMKSFRRRLHAKGAKGGRGAHHAESYHKPADAHGVRYLLDATAKEICN